MNKSRPLTPVSRPASTFESEGGLWRSWVNFWFTPVEPTGFHAIRLFAGILFLTWLLGFAGHQNQLFGLQGWFDTQAYKETSRLTPPNGSPAPITWSLLYVCGNNENLLTAFYWTSVVILALFTIGFATRLTSILTWLVVASFTANPTLFYDGDALLLILAFYLMIGHVFFGQLHREYGFLGRIFGGTDTWFLGRGARTPSLAANVTLRLLQVHFTIVILTAGLHKLQSGDWWSGAALWYPLYPPFETSLADIKKHVGRRDFLLIILSLATYLVLAWQIGFPLFAWRKNWRFVLIGGAIVGWLGTAFLYELPIFGPAFLIAALCFLTPDEWAWLTGWLPRVPGLNRLLDARAEATVDVGPRRSAAIHLTAGSPR